MSEGVDLERLLNVMIEMRERMKSRGGGTSGGGAQRLKDDYIMVAAIDFGTTFSGYAFSFRKNQTDIKMNKNWGAGLGFSAYKTPTCVLVDAREQFKAFGYEAQQQYASLVENQDRTHAFFERFKMKLHNNKLLTRNTRIEATNGKTMTALKVFSMALRYLKGHLMDQVNMAVEGEASADLVRWVLTVPAIWSDAAKQFMREAACDAGLIDDVSSGQLLIALEPEAASLYCRQLSIAEFVERSRGSEIRMRSGTKYIVIDAGGGTLDVTAHQIQDDGSVKELHFATGGPLGGMRVDEEFTTLMCDIFGKDFMDKYRSTSASQWLQMISDFEKKKRAVEAGKDVSTNIQLLWDFGSQYQSHKGQGVDVAFKKYRGSGVRFNNGQMCLSFELTRSLFAQVIDGIVKHIRELMRLDKLGGVKYFFLVGGFGECSLVQQAIFDNFKNVKVLVPGEASLAVLKGAVAFGHSPQSISSRVSARAYGVGSTSNFIAGYHDESEKEMIGGKPCVRNHFTKFVKKGQDVPLGHTKVMSFSPLRADQDEAHSAVFTTERDNVKYVTQAGVERHAQIKVDWPGTGLDRSIEIAMTFGGTEVQVDATCQPGNRHQRCKVNFFAQN